MNTRAFTLIELLIVVAIIGILAAIAVPNFLNAQIRAKVARVNSDLRALAMGLQTYQLDQNAFPANNSHHTIDLTELTTPVSYMSDVGFLDIFKPKQGDTGNNALSYLYFLYKSNPESPSMAWIDQAGQSQWSTDGFALSSWGPDQVQGARENNNPTGSMLGPPIEWVYIRTREGAPNPLSGVYTPSNGLISSGDIGRWGGNVPGVPQSLGG